MGWGKSDVFYGCTRLRHVANVETKAETGLKRPSLPYFKPGEPFNLGLAAGLAGRLG